MKRSFLLLGAAICAGLLGSPLTRAQTSFRAGVYAMDVSPEKLPVIVNGSFLERVANKITDPVYARALVLDDGATRIAIVVVDSCMMPRDLLDRAKDGAARVTGIPPERILISATHTHSAPSAMGALGSGPDHDYVRFLPGRISQAIERAAGSLQPAKIGWASVDDYEHTYCRRWIYRPDQMLMDPFGNRTVRANMHPGYQNPNTIAPSGPVDPGLSVIALQTTGGQPLALLANYSMHYFGATAVSADYYGHFANKVAAGTGAGPEFVAMMSQGTSGDQMWMDYGNPKSGMTLEAYAEGVAESALAAYKKIRYRPRTQLAMAESTLTLRRRTPNAKRLAWAREIATRMNGRKPQNQPEVYSLEQISLHEEPERELKLQALRIGDVGITAIPNEVFAITGLKLKAQSPLPFTFNIELANGSEGYIPPPEQHKLGGYTSWPARTAALQVDAEPRIVDALLGLLEKVAGKPRRTPDEANGAYARAVLASKPSAYWRLGEFSGPVARDATGNGLHAVYEDGIAFYLTGPESAAFSGDQANRSPHLAGGRVIAKIPGLSDAYTVEMWFWNGLPSGAREITGYLLGRGAEDSVALDRAGKLVLTNGAAGASAIAPKTWNHLALVRRGGAAELYLNGSPAPEITAKLPPSASAEVFIGGRHDGHANFEGKVDEVAIYGRVLRPAEISAHYRTARAR